MDAVIKCIECSSEYPISYTGITCSCGGLLQVEFREYPEVSWELFRSRPFGVWRYRELIPVPRDAEIVTMREGGTPLIRFSRIKEVLGVRESYVKFEGANPTGSFKDRGMTVGVTMAKYLGAKAVACASTGNTSSSMAAYASRAGLKPYVFLPKGKVAKGKLMQAVLHGATLIMVNGSFDDALSAVMQASRSFGVYVLNSLNPWRIEGQKTLAYEIADEVGVPDWVVLPVGNGGNISALWKGFKELKKVGLVDELPRLAGIQASGAAPLAHAFKEGLSKPRFVEHPETVATAIRIGRPVNWPRALRAARESRGVITSVTDEEILEAQRMLGRLEGVGVEPASAASLAGLRKLLDEGIIRPDEKVVIVATGHALKDPDIAVYHQADTVELRGDVNELSEVFWR
ncbi:MAG: threonine synthase [Desulfurococcales archaeon]|nr:threonine synthase [Desulfurococcales archaeon]